MPRAAACLLFLTTSSAITLAEIVPTPGTLRVEPVFESSDLVCNCSVQSLTIQDRAIEIMGRPAIHRKVAANVAINDVFKGPSGLSPSFRVRYDEEIQMGLKVRGSRLGLSEGETALLFLRESQPGYFEFADPFLGATPFHALSQTAGEPGLVKLQHALAATLKSPERKDRARALLLLQQFDSLDANALAAVAPFSNSDDPEIAFPALGALLKTRTQEGVERLRTYLDAHSSGDQPMAAISVGTELGEVSDSKCRKTLEELTTSRFVAIKYGAMDALRRMGDPESAPTLVARLDDPDQSVSYVALITLAEIFRKFDGDYAPSMYLFAKKPDYYTQLWKQWWAERNHKE